VVGALFLGFPFSIRAGRVRLALTIVVRACCLDLPLRASAARVSRAHAIMVRPSLQLCPLHGVITSRVSFTRPV